jgi:hypothetical protein
MQSTRYKNRWAVRVFEEWQENKAVMCENNPFRLDLHEIWTQVCSMTVKTFNFWLVEFGWILATDSCEKSQSTH